MTKPTEAPNSGPWMPTPWAPDDAYAIKAMANGTANEGQQKRVMAWLMDVSGLRDLSFRPDSARATDFAEGKRFVGLQIAKLLTLPAGVIDATKAGPSRSRRTTKT